MKHILHEIDLLIAKASIPEIARAVSMEGAYQASGTTVGREAWYADQLFPPRGARSCFEAFASAERARV